LRSGGCARGGVGALVGGCARGGVGALVGGGTVDDGLSPRDDPRSSVKVERSGSTGRAVKVALGERRALGAR
jgi:hypothetical protein